MEDNKPLAAEEQDDSKPAGAWKEHCAAGKRAYEDARYRDAAQAYEAGLREAESFGFKDARFAATLNHLARAYKADGRYAEAEPLFVSALGLRQASFGPESLEVAQTLNDLAALYAAERKFDEAEKTYQRSLKIQERARGAEDISLCPTLNNLALLYKTRGRFEQALPLFQRALRIGLRGLGPAHPFVATSLNNLGAICLSLGKHSEAEAFFRQSLAIKEKSLGPRHSEVATVLNNLAELYCAQGRLSEARPLCERVISIDEAIFGPDHPEVAADLVQLGSACEAAGDSREAERSYSRALDIRQRSLGLAHPLALKTRDRLAALRSQHGLGTDSSADFMAAPAAPEQAEPQPAALREEPPAPAAGLDFSEVSPAEEAVGGVEIQPSEPSELGTFDDAAALKGSTAPSPGSPAWRDRHALPIESGPELPGFVSPPPWGEGARGTRAGEGSFHALPVSRSDMTTPRNDEASVPPLEIEAENTGEPAFAAEAAPVDERIAAGRKPRVLVITAAEPGLDRPGAAQGLCELADRAAQDCRWIDAERLYRNELEIEQSLRGAEDPSVAATLNNLGLARRAQGELNEAAACFQTSLSLFLESQAALDSQVAVVLNNLATLCADREKYSEAEVLYRKSAEIVRRNPGDDRLAVIADNLAAFRSTQPATR